MSSTTTTLSFPVDIIGSQNINDVDEVVGYLEGLRNNPAASYYNCSSCDIHVTEGLHNMVKHRLFGDLSQPENPNHFAVSLNCPNCQKDICVRAGGQWWTVEDMMRSSKFEPGAFYNVSRPIDHLILYVVNQIWYQQYEREEGGQVFLPTPPNESAKLMWINGNVIGFYTVKQKGSLYDRKTLTTYALPVLDLIYVRKKFRQYGYATYMLENFISFNLGEPVGISAPISEEMYIVLYKFLQKHADLRDFMWETSYTGDIGYRKNLWLSLKLTQLHKSETSVSESRTTSVASKEIESRDIQVDVNDTLLDVNDVD